MSRRLGIIFFGICLSHQLLAQERDSSTALSITAASLVPASIASAIYLLNYEAFWKYAAEVPFWISPDPPYAMHIDKFAHGYLSALGTTGIAGAYKLAGVNEKTATWLGAGITFGLGIMVEMEDARHGNDPQYGFSPGDAFGDFLGSALPVLQYYFPAFRRIQPKIFLWKSDVLWAYNSIADDYESQYFWLSFDLHDLLHIPSWLNLAAGFGCENLPGVSWIPSRAGKHPYTDFYFAPDLNLKGIPVEGDIWKRVTDILQWIRIPLPAIQIYPRIKVWGLR